MQHLSILEVRAVESPEDTGGTSHNVSSSLIRRCPSQVLLHGSTELTQIMGRS